MNIIVDGVRCSMTIVDTCCLVCVLQCLGYKIEEITLKVCRKLDNAGASVPAVVISLESEGRKATFYVGENEVFNSKDFNRTYIHVDQSLRAQLEKGEKGLWQISTINKCVGPIVGELIGLGFKKFLPSHVFYDPRMN